MSTDSEIYELGVLTKRLNVIAILEGYPSIKLLMRVIIIDLHPGYHI